MSRTEPHLPHMAQVAPAELEDLLSSHPKIADAAVIPVAGHAEREHLRTRPHDHVCTQSRNYVSTCARENREYSSHVGWGKVVSW